MKVKLDSCILLVPTLNEESNITKILKDAKTVGIKSLVIDGNSKDRTVELAKKEGANVILQKGKGKGNAVIEAFNHIITNMPQYEYIAMIDGDLTYPVEAVPAMLQLFENNIVMVNGGRLNDKMEPGAMKRLNYVGNKLLTLLANVLHNTGIQDMLSGLKILRVEAVKKILPDMKAEGFATETEMTILISKHGKINNYPIRYMKRGGETKLNPYGAGYRIFKQIIKML